MEVKRWKICCSYSDLSNNFLTRKQKFAGADLAPSILAEATKMK